MSLKLGTWNLMSPVAETRRTAMHRLSEDEQADVWVLTETHDGFTPGHPLFPFLAEGRDGLHKPEHRWVAIWFVIR